APAECLLFFSMADFRKMENMLDREFADPRKIEIARAKLDQMYGYCITNSCRRQVLLSYFDEEIEPCGNCDRCGTPKVKSAPVSGNFSKNIVSAAREVDGKLTTQEFVSFLLGMERAKTTKMQMNTSRFFGMAKTKGRTAVEEEVEGLISAGTLCLRGKNVMRVCAGK
ncbi:MAG: RecQ family zinc-binding domain-containing protein, partial [Methanocorpusculum sp.]|nr:RecQ family zinc-binding domain-containing protein [Methanocorpusculum sp.]